MKKKCFIGAEMLEIPSSKKNINKRLGGTGQSFAHHNILACPSLYCPLPTFRGHMRVWTKVEKSRERRKKRRKTKRKRQNDGETGRLRYEERDRSREMWVERE
jgi:hypothetical protein